MAAPAYAPDQAAEAEKGWLLLLAVLVVGTFMSVLDSSIVNVAIPRMQTALSAAPDDVEWVATGYTLALGVAVPLAGWLGERIGKAQLYIVSIIGFAVASGLCGLAWNLSSMIAFRILQAIPGGILPVVAMTLLFQIVPPAKVGTAMGIYGLGIVVAPAVGPTLGGYLVQYVDWRLIFYINVPVGLLGAVAAIVKLPRQKPVSWPSFDFWGFITIAYGLFAGLLAASEGHTWGWDGYRIRGLLVTSAISLALFVVIELEVENPLLDLRVFKRWPYVNSIILLAVVVTALFSGLYFIPQYLQNVQGLQAFDTGLVLIPSALIMVVMMPIAGRIYDAVGPRWPVAIGLGIIAYSSFLLAGLTPDTPRFDIEVWTTIRNFGTGLCMMAIMTSGISALPPRLTGAGSGMNNVVQRVSSSLAVAVFGSLNFSAAAQLWTDNSGLLSTGAQALPQVSSASAQGANGLMGMYQAMNLEVTTLTYDNGFYIVAWMCVGGAILALGLRSGKPKASAEPVHVEL
ncbi:DHA2 family efflux MFS transporter permease subunit [Pseudonocardia spinosispora]|uniref:DHA2 family efflux MFS transporter permease subunit n=1 Tax=Pseudonocardia spinosispora TaxID=103441 RepID=UPI0003FEB6AB|nr:DHA2 family efflux MFS transporter permease subunit [Pseudonocardia spinosispora]